jgi:hypothetical protein
MKTIYSITIFSVCYFGCNSEPTLQKYFVENTENKDFALDVSPSILNVQIEIVCRAKWSFRII